MSTLHQKPILALALIHVFLVAGCAVQYGFAWTEVGLLPTGILDWQYGHFDAFRVNPPLVRLWATLPLQAIGAEVPLRGASIDPRDRLEWTLAETMLQSDAEAAHRWLIIARLSCLPFTVLGMCVAARWARQLYGPAAGVGAAILWAFFPHFIGYGCLISGDAQAASMGLLTFYLFRGWLDHPAFVETYQLGLVAGLTMLCKSSWLILLVLLPALWLFIRIVDWIGVPKKRSSDIPPPLRWLEQLRSIIVVIAIAVFIVNLMYGFAGSFRRLDSFAFISKTLSGSEGWQSYAPFSGNRFEGTWLGSVPVPLPKDLVMGVDLQKWDFDRERWSYLHGQWQNHGWWYYYLYAAAIKVPLGFLALFIIATVGSMVKTAWRGPWRDELLLWTPMLLIMIGASLETGLNRHLRYILPAFPFAIVMISRVFGHFASMAVPMRMTLAITTASMVASSLWIYPHSLSYFNETIGGPRQAHRHLNASNLDWGQDLPYLRRWQDSHPEKRPLLVTNYLHLIDPEAVGIEADGRVPTMTTADDRQFRSDPTTFAPGWYAIDRESILRRGGDYAYLRSYAPSYWAGYGFQIYEITPSIASELNLRERNRLLSRSFLRIKTNDEQE